MDAEATVTATDGTEAADHAVARLAGAIAEPARARMLCCLMDGHARTATELAVVAGTAPSTASAHLARLKDEALVTVQAQGRHRYYQLADRRVATALEALMVLGGRPVPAFEPSTPARLRPARSCYDHLAGELAVGLHDAWLARGWLRPLAADARRYDVSPDGEAALAATGIEVAPLRAQRRRLACACLDWSERRPHLGGALGAALLSLALQRRWLQRELDSRELRVTPLGRRELVARFGVAVA